MACLIAPLSTTLNDLQCVAAENPSYAPETQLRPEWPEKLSHLIRKFWRNGYTQPLNFRTQVLHSWLPNNCLPDTLNFNPTQRFLATPLFLRCLDFFPDCDMIHLSGLRAGLFLRHARHPTMHIGVAAPTTATFSPPTLRSRHPSSNLSSHESYMGPWLHPQIWTCRQS